MLLAGWFLWNRVSSWIFLNSQIHSVSRFLEFFSLSFLFCFLLLQHFLSWKGKTINQWNGRHEKWGRKEKETNKNEHLVAVAGAMNLSSRRISSFGPWIILLPPPTSATDRNKDSKKEPRQDSSCLNSKRYIKTVVVPLTLNGNSVEEKCSEIDKTEGWESNRTNVNCGCFLRLKAFIFILYTIHSELCSVDCCCFIVVAQSVCSIWCGIHRWCSKWLFTEPHVWYLTVVYRSFPVRFESVGNILISTLICRHFVFDCLQICCGYGSLFYRFFIVLKDLVWEY